MIYNPEQPSYHILICLIEVWNIKKDQVPQDLMMPKGKADFMIAEVENIEIRDSYRNVIGSASITFPRGTVIKKTIDAIDPEEYASAITADISPQGALIETRTNSDVAKTSDFNVGSRIRIRLGYTTDPEVRNMTKISLGKPSIFTSEQVYNDYISHLTTMFEGYITKCSVDTPIQIECEDLAHLLKCVTCKKITTTNKSTVKNLMCSQKRSGKSSKRKSSKSSKRNKAVDKDGVYGLLSKTGLKLHPDTEDIVIGKCSINSDFTVFDILNQWHKWKIFAYLAWDNDGNPCIAVRNTYFSGGKGSLIDAKEVVPIEIDFAYHVANNNLKAVDTDKKSLAIQASCKDKDERKITSLTLMSNPEWKEGQSEKERWRVINETKISKKAMKKHHIKMVSQESSKVNLSEYTVVEYQSRKIGLTHDQLLKEAIAYYEAYNKNGVEGDITIFGDLKLKSTNIVQLKDVRFPMKNGKYLVEQVLTSFGVSGFRQTVTLPYCISRKEQSKNDRTK